MKINYLDLKYLTKLTVQGEKETTLYIMLDGTKIMNRNICIFWIMHRPGLDNNSSLEGKKEEDEEDWME